MGIQNYNVYKSCESDQQMHKRQHREHFSVYNSRTLDMMNHMIGSFCAQYVNHIPSGQQD